MKPIDVFEKMAILDDDLIDAATLPEPAATRARAGGFRSRLAAFSDFMNRPAVVAAACVLVTFGVLAGIIAAGRMGGNYKSDATIGYPEDDRPNYSVDAEQTVEENAEEKDSNLSDGFGSSAGVNPPEEDVSEPATGEDSEIALPDVLPSVPTVDVSIWWGNEGMNLPQYVVAYSGTVMTANGAVNMEMDGPGARYQLEAIAGELVTIRYKGDMGVGLPPTCTPRDWVMYNEDFVVVDQSDNFDKLADAVALMKGPMEDGESHSVYIVLAVDYKGGQNRGIFEYAFRVQFGDEGENLDTTPVDPEEDSTIANEGWGTDTPETESPAAEYIPSSKYVTYENDRYILTTPLYGKRISFDKYNAHYVDDIDDALVEAAERTIVEQASQYDDEIYLYFETLYEDGRLYLATELIVPAPPEEAAGCGDHKHLVFREPITR